MEYYVEVTNEGVTVAEGYGDSQQEAVEGLNGLTLPNDRVTVYEALRASDEGGVEVVGILDTWKVT